MSRTVVLIVAACFSVPAFGVVPDQYLGAWVLDLPATEGSIADSSDIPEERKPEVIERFRGLQAEIEISQNAMVFHGLSARPYSIDVTLEDLEEGSPDHTLLSGVMVDPYNKRKREMSIELHLSDSGQLSVKMESGDPLSAAIWKRDQLGTGDDSGGPPGDVIGYLDSLKACEPGEFRFSYPGFGTYSNTIVGREGDHCQVRIEHPQIRMTCNYSEAMIALLTNEQKYEDARNGVLRGSTDSEESRLMRKECSVE